MNVKVKLRKPFDINGKCFHNIRKHNHSTFKKHIHLPFKKSTILNTNALLDYTGAKNKFLHASLTAIPARIMGVPLKLKCFVI